MPIIKPDLSETSSAVLESGNYPGKLIDHEAKVSSKGNPMLEFNVEVEYDGKTYPRKIWVPTSGKGAFQFERLLRACHFDDEANKAVKGELDEFDTDVLNGQELIFTIEPDEYNGQVRDKITGFLPR
jgi:hypothetical protein